MNSSREKPLILFLEPNEDNFRYLQRIFLHNNYNVQGVFDLTEAIKKTIELSPDLIVCNSVLPEFDGFHIYNLLENSIFKTGIPFVIIMEKFNQLEIEYGLELGIDNFIFKPFIEKRIVKKVNVLLNKVNQHRAFYVEQFDRLFEDNLNAIVVLCNNKIQKVNSAFRTLINSTGSKFKIKEIEKYFELNTTNKILFFRCIKGLDANCLIENVKVENSNCLVDLYVSNIDGGASNCVLIQIIKTQLEDKNTSETLQDWSISNYLQNYIGEDHSWENKSKKHLRTNLTDRELQITTLSAKGYQIKEIAYKLGISSRTVEKHRSNVMRKTGSSNIIEAIAKVVES